VGRNPNNFPGKLIQIRTINVYSIIKGGATKKHNFKVFSSFVVILIRFVN